MFKSAGPASEQVPFKPEVTNMRPAKHSGETSSLELSSSRF